MNRWERWGLKGVGARWLVPRRCWWLVMGGKNRLMVLVSLEWG